MRWILGFAAAVAGLAIGCARDENRAGTDAANRGAAPDMQRDTEPPGPVKVTVFSPLSARGSPDLEATVVFQNADGSVSSSGRVDALGQAQADVTPGGTVTTIHIDTYVPEDPSSIAVYITSVLGVRPGDDISIGLPDDRSGPNGSALSMSASFPPIPDAARVALATSCGVYERNDASYGDGTVILSSSCVGPTYDLLGVAYGGQLTIPKYIAVHGVDAVPRGTVALPGPFAPMESFAARLTNIPEAVSGLTVTRASLVDGISVVPQGVACSDPGDALTVSVPYPPGFGSGNEIAIAISRPETRTLQHYDLHTSSVDGSADVDLSALPLPWLLSVTPRNTGVTWTTLDAAGTPDGMLTEWNGRVDNAILRWHVVQPYQADGMTLPRLPPGFAGLDPAVQAFVKPTSAAVLVVDFDSLSGYDEVRQLPDVLLGSPINHLGLFVSAPFQRRSLVARSSDAPRP